MKSMKLKAKGSRMLQAAVAGLFAGASLSAGAAIDLTGAGYVTYGDANSYSMPLNGFDVASTPGAIKDLVVVATGADGQPVNTNIAGIDAAVSMPTGQNGAAFVSTEADPWQANLAALTGASGVGTTDLVFFFNNNQINSGASTNQTLAAWAQLWITDSNGNVVNGPDGGVFQLTNLGGAFALFPNNGGVALGDPGAYTAAGIGDPLVGTNASTDYVYSGGAVNGVNHNLGADSAAYAVVFPELNALIASLANLSGYTLNIDFRLGCDTSITNTADCVGRSLNNGYEQIFIGSAEAITLVPEPSSMALAGLALMGIFGAKRRARRG